jgi:hypothetical protein
MDRLEESEVIIVDMTMAWHCAGSWLRAELRATAFCTMNACYY